MNATIQCVDRGLPIIFPGHIAPAGGHCRKMSIFHYLGDRAMECRKARKAGLPPPGGRSISGGLARGPAGEQIFRNGVIPTGGAMTRGRKPMPTGLKIVTGTVRADRRNLAEPRPVTACPESKKDRTKGVENHIQLCDYYFNKFMSRNNYRLFPAYLP